MVYQGVSKPRMLVPLSVRVCDPHTPLDLSQAVELGTGNLVPDIKDLLSTLLATLEHDKLSLDLGPEDARHCTDFALGIFGRADRADRAGARTRTTAMTFYAASIFLEILNQFSELGPEMLMKQRYAAWRAADVRKALGEGREPDPPPSAEMPPVTDEDAEFLRELQSMPSVGREGHGTGHGAGAVGPAPSAHADPPPSYPDHDANADEAAGASSAPQDLAPLQTPRDGSAGNLDLPSPPSSPLIPRRASSTAPVWTPPPPRTFHVFQKVQ